MLTHSQESVYNRILALGQLHFAPNARYGLSVSPRLFPLIVGPTGSGKTMLVQKAAGALEATTLRVTFGDWMPQGVRSEAGSSTLFSILECVEANARVLLHLDELDKCAEDYSGSWSRSVANDLWNALDRKFPVEPYLRKQGKPCTPCTVSALEERVLKNLWIVGSGTWQAVFNQKAVRSIGFVTGPGASSESEEELTAAIIRTKMIPDELLARYSSDLLFVHYPATVEEKSRLLDGLGIAALAERMGEKIDASRLNFEGTGMRLLESLATRLLLRAHTEQLSVATAAVTPTTGELPTLPSPLSAVEPPKKLFIAELDGSDQGRDALLFPAEEALPQTGTRMQRLRGKGVQGWTQILTKDPAYDGFGEWCRKFELPQPPPPTLIAFRPWGKDRDSLEPQPLATAEELYAALLRAKKLKVARVALNQRFDREIAHRLSAQAFRDIEALNQYCIKKALTGQPIGNFIHSGEIMRQLRYDILRGALLAADWTRLHAKEGKNMRPVESRIQSLWCHGMDKIEHVSEWDSISELFDRPNGCEFLDDPEAAVQWSELPAQFRFKVNYLFEGSVRMTD